MKDILIKLIVLLIVLLGVLAEFEIVWLILKRDFEIELKIVLLGMLVSVPVILLHITTSKSKS